MLREQTKDASNNTSQIYDSTKAEGYAYSTVAYLETPSLCQTAYYEFTE